MVLSIDTDAKTITVQGSVMINELISKLNSLVADWYNYKLVQVTELKTKVIDDGIALLPYTTKSNIFR